MLFQRAKKVVSDSPGLVDFAIGLVFFVLNLPDGQVLFFWEIQITEGLLSILPIKKGLGLVEMTCGLVHAIYSLAEWQAVKLTFFAPCISRRLPLPLALLLVTYPGHLLCWDSTSSIAFTLLLLRYSTLILLHWWYV